MQCNVGGSERTLRFVVGAAALAAALFIEMSTGLRTALLVVGAIGLLTATARICPLNALIGRNSCRTR